MKNTNIDRSASPVVESWILEHCPSCYETLKPQAIECDSCGVVLSHFQKVAIEKRLKLTIGGLSHLTSSECMELEKAWQKIEAVYYDSSLHDQFLHLCLRLKSLPYAVKKYQDRLGKDSLDEIAATMRTRASLLVSEALPAGRVWQEREEMSLLMRAMLRTLTVVLILGVCAGSVLMLISALTAQKIFFLAMGVFITAGCLLCAGFLVRLQR